MPTALAARKCPSSWMKTSASRPPIAIRPLSRKPLPERLAHLARAAASASRTCSRASAARPSTARAPARRAPGCRRTGSARPGTPRRPPRRPHSGRRARAHRRGRPRAPARGSGTSPRRPARTSRRARSPGRVAARHGRPARMGQRVGDRDAHVRQPEMREQGAVAQPHEPCTIDCGCTTTSMRSYGTSNSQCASMISRPLFMRVAESIVMRAPMARSGGEGPARP